VFVNTTINPTGAPPASRHPWASRHPDGAYRTHLAVQLHMPLAQAVPDGLAAVLEVLPRLLRIPPAARIHQGLRADAGITCAAALSRVPCTSAQSGAGVRGVGGQCAQRWAMLSSLSSFASVRLALLVPSGLSIQDSRRAPPAAPQQLERTWGAGLAQQHLPLHAGARDGQHLWRQALCVATYVQHLKAILQAVGVGGNLEAVGGAGTGRPIRTGGQRGGR